MQRGAREAQAALAGIEKATDRAVQSEKALIATQEKKSREQQKSTRETVAWLRALAQVDRANGDYTSAIRTLEQALSHLSVTSKEYLRIQAQIIQLQQQAARQTASNAISTARDANGGLNFRGVTQGLSALGGPVGDVGSKLALMSTQVEGAVAGLGLLGGAATAIIAAFAAAGAAIVKFGLDGVKLSDEIDDVGQALGFTQNQMERLNAAVKISGENLSFVERSFSSFEEAVKKGIEDPSSNAAKALKTLGVDMQNAAREPQREFLRLLETLDGVTGSIQKQTAARELFSRNTFTMIRVSQEFREIQKQTSEALERSNLILGQSGTDAARKVDREFNQLSLVFENVKRGLVVELAPAFLEFAKVGVKTMRDLAPAAQDVASAISAIVPPLAKALDLATKFNSVLAQTPAARIARWMLSDSPQTAQDYNGPSAPAAAGRLSRFPRFNAGNDTIALGHTPGVIDRPFAPSVPTTATRSAPRFEFDALSDETSKRLRNMADAAKYASQELPELRTGLSGVRDELQQTRQTLSILMRDGATGTKEYADAFKKFNDLMRQQAQLLGTINGRVPRVGDFPTIDATGRLVLGDAPPIARGGIPGQFDAGQAPDPRNFPLSLKQQFFGRTTGSGEQIIGVGEMIAQDFIRGALMGQADARRAGEDIAFFFADYFSKKATEALRKSLDSAFDFIGDLIGRLFSKIGSGGGLLGSILGAFIPGRAEGGPVSAGMLYETHGLARQREFFVPQSNGFIVNQQQAAMAMSGGGGGSVVQNFYFNVSAPNGQVSRQSMDQLSTQVTFAAGRAARNKGA